jgi:hypothetical protein
MSKNFWVCADCHFGYHYGYTQVGDDQWIVGDMDSEPTDVEPLRYINFPENFGKFYPDEGRFVGCWFDSSSPCDGCGQTLAGARVLYILED